MIVVYKYPLKALDEILIKLKMDKIETFNRFSGGDDELRHSGSIVPLNPNRPNITRGKNVMKSL